MMKWRVGVLTVFMCMGFVGVACGGAKLPFDAKWQSWIVIWDFRRNDLMCHDEKATLVGEEEPTIVVGSDAQGHPQRQKFRLLTFNCKTGRHTIRMWMDERMDLIREVTCHGSNVCDNKGYDEDAHGHVLRCPEGPQPTEPSMPSVEGKPSKVDEGGHRIVLEGSEKEGK